MLPDTYVNVYACPSCKELFYKTKWLSGNSFKSKVYSDGKVFRPMMPSAESWGKCASCQQLFKSCDAELIGDTKGKHHGKKIDFDHLYLLRDKTPLQTKYDNGEINCLFALSSEDYLNLIQIRRFDNEGQELELRLKLWWGWNDRVRNDWDGDFQPYFTYPEQETLWSDNLYLLLKFIDLDTSNGIAMTAEIHRNLGDFDQCIRILEHQKSKPFNELKVLFLEQKERPHTHTFQLDWERSSGFH